jgi:hypothetical protein
MTIFLILLEEGIEVLTALPETMSQILAFLLLLEE